MYDENGMETTDAAAMVTCKYKVRVMKRSNNASFASLQLLKDPMNTSTMSLVLPTDVGGHASSAPLEGKYIINCPDPLNPTAIAQTKEISYGSWGPSIEHIIQ